MTRTIRLIASAILGLCALWGALAGAAEPAQGPGSLAFLRVSLPRKDVYLGELLPLRVQAFFRPGIQVTINGAPVLKSDAFTTGQITDKPRQTQETVNGQPYAVLTWNTALSAVKTGDFPLSLQLPCTVQYREAPARAPDLRELFGADPFGDDPFAGFGEQMLGRSMLQDLLGKVREKQVLLTSRVELVQARPLPAAGRPDGFGGAIGDFAIQASASPTSVTAGDPITLKLEVSGAGNFDRVSDGMLQGSAVWKTYPPSSRFTAANTAGSQGTRTFEQAVVPQQAGRQEIPSLRFSFFDPRAHRYVTHATAPIPVQVAVAPAQRLVAGAPATAPQQQTSAATGQELLPNQVEAGRPLKTLVPLFLQPWFLAAQALPVLALAAGLLLQGRRRRLLQDPSLARSRAAAKAVRRQLAAMEQAAAAQDTDAFFRAARGALRQRLGQRWAVNPEAITLSEIDRRLPGEAAGLRPIFEFADHISYSGQDLGAADLTRWRRAVLEQLRSLEAAS